MIGGEAPVLTSAQELPPLLPGTAATTLLPGQELGSISSGSRDLCLCGGLSFDSQVTSKRLACWRHRAGLQEVGLQGIRGQGAKEVASRAAWCPRGLLGSWVMAR